MRTRLKRFRQGTIPEDSGTPPSRPNSHRTTFLNDNNIKNCFVEPLVGFINNEVVVINMPLTDEDLFIDELLNQIKTSTIKLDQETIDKCAVLLSHYSADCSAEI